MKNDMIRLKGEHCVCAAMTCGCTGDEACGDCREYSVDALSQELELSKVGGGGGYFHLRIARMIALELDDGTLSGERLVMRDGRAVPEW